MRIRTAEAIKPLWRLGAACTLAIVLFGAPSAQAQTESRTRERVVSPQDQALHDLLVKAKADADARNYSAAQADYEKYLSQRPDDAAAHFDLGYVYTAQQETDKAIGEYRKAIALDPKMMEAHLNLGMSLLAENPKDAVAALEKVVQLNYAFERGHYLLGIAEERSGNAAAAEKEYTIAAKLNPDDAEAHAALARILLVEQQAVRAEAEFRQTLALKKNDADAELGLTRSLILQKKSTEAEAALTDYLKENPRDAMALVLQASLLFGAGKYDQALSALDQAALSAPETVDALKLRSEIYYGKKDWPNAASALQKAEHIAPNDAIIHARLGYVLLQTQDYSNSAREIEESLRLDPGSTDTLRDLVSAEYLGKDYSGTLQALDMLAKSEPPNAGVWFVRGSCYDHLHQPQAALDAYNKFLAMNTDKNSNQYFEAAARVRFLQKLIKQKGR